MPIGSKRKKATEETSIFFTQHESISKKYPKYHFAKYDNMLAIHLKHYNILEEPCVYIYSELNSYLTKLSIASKMFWELCHTKKAAPCFQIQSWYLYEFI